jgi:peptide/nickel transport system substrate-binding protein
MSKKLLASWLLILALILVACGGDTGGEPVDEERDDPVATDVVDEEMEEEEDDGQLEAGEDVTEEEDTELSAFGEAPMLAEMVAAGDLPPVEERLPVAADISVVAGVDGIGEYGGTWHNVSWEQPVGNIKMILYDPPVRWNENYTGYKPGLAKSWEFNEDGTQVTFHFREGVKWSDGTPFTTADLQFWWEDIATNPDYRVVQVPWWGFNSDDTPMTVEFPDDYTMVLTWDRPAWIMPSILAQGFWEWEPLVTPRHYLEQFHPDYNSDAAYEDLEVALRWYENPDFPVLTAWKVESATPGERIVFVRNPYYWKTDAEGNQLPYIDRLDVAIIQDEEIRVLEASQGKYEASFRASTNPTDIPFLAEQSAANGYHLHQGAVNGAGGWPCWLVNQNFNDSDTYDNWEDIGDVLRDQNFRQGISHAMDRDRLINVVWDGIGTPKQSTISPQSWHFASPEGQAVFEEWANSYASHDPELANTLLDEAGVVDGDGDGWRDLPTGDEFTLVLDVTGWPGERVSIASNESFAADLEAVGIRTLLNNVIGTPEDDLRQTQALYMLRACHASELDIWTYPDWVFPLRDNRAWPMEGKYRQTGGAEGWEPTGAALALQEIYDRGLAEGDVNARHELVWEAVRVHIDQGPFMIGAAGDQPMPVVVADNFMGIPELVILGPWAPGSPGNLHPEQFWMDQ